MTTHPSPPPPSGPRPPRSSRTPEPPSSSPSPPPSPSAEPPSELPPRREILTVLIESTEELLRTATELTPEQLAGPSLLPGWTRGHVLTHLARNADGLGRALTGVARGVSMPVYRNPEERDAEIVAGAGRPLREQIADLRASAARLEAAFGRVPGSAWDTSIERTPGGRVFPASQVPWKRLAEVEYHHVDLDAGYTPAHWPAFFTVREAVLLAGRFRGAPGVPGVLLRVEDLGPSGRELRIGAEQGEPELAVEGPSRAVVAWMSGRAPGDGLTVRGHGGRLTDARPALPDLPAMA